MADFLSPVDFRKYFYASLFLAIICFIGAIIAIGSSGQGNLLENSIAGHGTIDIRHDSSDASDRAMAENASIAYEAKRSWGQDDASSFSTSFIVSGAKGGYKNQYAVKGSGSSHKVIYKATQISGDFTGQGDITVTGTMATGQNFDSVIEMSSQRGNATFQGRVYNAKKGRPATIEELDAVGQFIIKSHLNVSDKLEVPEDPLGFCASLDRIMPKDALDGVYVAPVGYVLNKDGQLVRGNATG